jgi:NAD(P)-dependent dehydrogenase (short-subunit alcohol dehydrogenase family)
MVGSWSQSQHNISIPQLASETSLIEYLDDSKNFDRFAQYQNSKLSINAVIKHLATIIPADQVLMNVCCPGIVETNLSRDYPLWLSFIMFFWRMVLARTAEVGARALIYAIRVAGVETHGQFLSHNEVAVYVSYFRVVDVG